MPDWPRRVEEQNVTSTIVAGDMCIGCGICSAVCPADNLRMSVDWKGELVPAPLDNCVDGCNLCLNVCPFADSEEDETSIADRLFRDFPGIQFNDYVGYVHRCFAGFSTCGTERETGASGGMVTWLLRELLETGEVGGIIAAAPSQSRMPLIKTTAVFQSDDLQKCRGSFYCQAEYSESLHTILNGPEMPYAIVALPCTAKAIRLAANHNAKLRRRVRYILGLVCGQCPSSFYTEFLAAWGGIDPELVGRVNYRTYRRGERNVQNHGVRVISRDGKKQSPVILYRQLPYYLWTNHLFTPRACGYCDDIFAEVADAVFMDAWLPEYVKDVRGTSLIVSRNPRLSAILEDGARRRASHLVSVTVDRILESQKANVKKKRQLLRARLAWAYERQEPWIPRKRVDPSEELLKRYRAKIEVQEKFREVSKKLWLHYRDKKWPWLMSRVFLLVCFSRVGHPAVRLIDDTHGLLPLGLRWLVLPLRFLRMVTRRVCSSWHQRH